MDTPTGPSATLGAACERLSLRHDGRPDRGVSMPLDLNDAPLRLERRVIATAAPEPPAERPRSRYVSWIAAQQMVMGRGLEVLRLAGVSWPPPRGDKTNCPFPDHPDHNPSWRFSEECGRWFCSCGSGDVFDALVKLRRAPDFEAAKLLAAEMLNRRDAITEPREGVTLNTFAAHKGLPIDSLRDCGLSDGHHRGGPAVRIRYRAEDGTELDPRWRIALTGDLKTVSPKGATTALYGLDRRDEVLERGFVLAVEGETDALTAWHRGWPAIGLPGASNFRDDRDAAWFDGIEKIRRKACGAQSVRHQCAAARPQLHQPCVARSILFPPNVDQPEPDQLAEHLADFRRRREVAGGAEGIAMHVVAAKIEGEPTCDIVIEPSHKRIAAFFGKEGRPCREVAETARVGVDDGLRRPKKS